MEPQLEIFECSVFINSVEINCFKPKKIQIRLQMGDMEKIIDIASFEIIKEGRNEINILKGIKFMTRLNIKEAFCCCPIYIYFCNPQNQTICACGFDMSALVVDSFRKLPETYTGRLVLQNRYDQEIGAGYFEFFCRHFSQDLSIIQNFVEDTTATQEANSVFTEQPQLEENARANVMIMTRKSKKRYIPPMMKDLLILTKKYQKSRFGLEDEVEVLENQVRMIEQRQSRILQKKNQEKRRKKDVNQPLTPDTSSVHTSDFSYFENSSDYSYNSIMNQTFKDVENTCGKKFTHHKTHHNRHKEHHHHHHHKKEPELEPEPEPEPKPEPKQDSQLLNSKDHSSARSSKISQSGFDAFLQRQNAASERRKSFTEQSGKDNISFTSQNSHISSKKPSQKPSKPEQQQPPKQQEAAQTQVTKSKQQKEQPTSQTTKPTKPEQKPSKPQQQQSQTQKEQQKKEDQKETKQQTAKKDEVSKKDEESKVFSSDENSKISNASSKRENSSSRMSRASSRASNSSSRIDNTTSKIENSTSKVESSRSSSSKSAKSSRIEAVSTVETLDIPSESSKIKSDSSTSARSKSSRKSSSSRASSSSTASEKTSNLSSVDEDFVDEPSTSNIIDVEQSSHVKNESSQKLSSIMTQETLDIDDDDVEEIEQKSSVKVEPEKSKSKTSKEQSKSKEKTKPESSTSGVEFTASTISKNDTEHISPSDSEMDEKDEHSSITESIISKKTESEEDTKTKQNLDDINLSELLDGLNDSSVDASSLPSELKNDLGIDSESVTDLKITKKDKTEKKEKKSDTPPPSESKSEEKSEEKAKEEKSQSSHKGGISEMQSGIDIDDIFSD